MYLPDSAAASQHTAAISCEGTWQECPNKSPYHRPFPSEAHEKQWQSWTLAATDFWKTLDDHNATQINVCSRAKAACVSQSAMEKTIAASHRPRRTTWASQVPQLPRHAERIVNGTKCHTCHAKARKCKKRSRRQFRPGQTKERHQIQVSGLKLWNLQRKL